MSCFFFSLIQTQQLGSFVDSVDQWIPFVHDPIILSCTLSFRDCCWRKISNGRCFMTGWLRFSLNDIREIKRTSTPPWIIRFSRLAHLYWGRVQPDSLSKLNPCQDFLPNHMRCGFTTTPVKGYPTHLRADLLRLRSLQCTFQLLGTVLLLDSIPCLTCDCQPMQIVTF